MRSPEKPTTVSPWMDAAFALDELHNDPLFGELKTLVDEFQRRKVLASDEPGNETLSAFLNEMEQLDVEMTMQIDEPAACKSPTAFDSVDPTALRRKKKKVSSTERRKQEKARLLSSIDELQRQLEEATSGKEQVHVDWVHRALNEWSDKEQKLRENQQIRRALALEQSYAGTVALLLHQLSATTKNVTYCEASPGLQDDAVADAAIFEMLQHNISDNYGRLVQEWQRGSIPIASSEAVDATISPDGNVMTYKFARLIPFDVVTVMDTAWRSGQSDFHDGMSRTVFQQSPDDFCVKEELTIHPAGQLDVTLCVRVAIKRFVSENMSIFLWETVGDWATSASSESTTTQESGWVLIRPAESAGYGGAPVSVVQSFIKMTLSETSCVWMQLRRSSGVMLHVILPSYQHIMLDRLQRFENRLMDEALAGYKER